VTTPPPPPWVAWAPPLDPPTTGGLAVDQAQQIAFAWWDQSPHMCAALQWEAYAASLPPTPAVSAVSTGAQSVAYSPAAPTGQYGLAIQRAEWHRSFTLDELVSVPLRSTARHPSAFDYPWSQWWPVDEITPPPPELATPVPPVASFTVTPALPGPDTVVTFDASGSAAGDNPLATYDWVFDAYGAQPDAGPVVTWRTPGEHLSLAITVTVTDTAGLADQAVAVIAT
jgi:hypothetical protein